MKGINLDTCLTAVLLGGTVVRAQAHRQLRYESEPSQLAATYEWTETDYAVRLSATRIQEINLSGGAVEYAFRGLYPWEGVAAIQYQQGQPLGQRLITMSAGAGYCRGFGKVIPFGRLLAGVARSSSSWEMYQSAAPRTGLSIETSAGVDYKLKGRLGLRILQVQNQYLPFGARGSVYWTLGTGLTYRFRR